MSFGSIRQIKLRLLGQWERGRFYKAFVRGEIFFPLEAPVKGPGSAEMVSDFAAVRTWISDIQSGCKKNGLHLVWKEINHRHLGRNSIPYKIIFSDMAELAGFLGKKSEFRTFDKGLVLLCSKFPDLSAWVGQYPFELLKNVPEIEKLVSIVEWRMENPHPGIYLRQLSLPGVDTKFIEKHRSVLGQWLNILLDEKQICYQYTGVGKFEERFGFLSRPETVRFRIPDPDLRIGDFSDLTVRADEFAELNIPVRYVFVVENDITALAFPFVKNAIVIFGRGYNFNHLAKASWINEKELWYWGDIDTHGFAILNQFRTYFPSTRSFLMDKKTLMSHQDHWGMENKPATADLLELSKEEALLYEELKNNTIRDSLRLEQEFIDFSRVREVVGAIL